MSYGKDDYNLMSAKRRRAFKQISDKLGKKHAITKMMGSLSYGRHKFEQGPDGNLRNAIAEYGFLEGFFDALNLWARDNDSNAQKIMLDLWPKGMEKAK